MDGGGARPPTVSLDHERRNAVHVTRGAARVFSLDLQGHKKAHKAQTIEESKSNKKNSFVHVVPYVAKNLEASNVFEESSLFNVIHPVYGCCCGGSAI
jgi:hypothetical protein